MVKRTRSAALPALLLSLLLTVCTAVPALGQDGDVEALLSQVTLHEKVCQLFFVQPEQFSRLDRVNAPSAALRRAFSRFPLGGVALFESNIRKSTLSSLTASLREYARNSRGIAPFLGVDEEGGGVSRLANKLKLKEKQPAAGIIGQSGDPRQAYRAALTIGAYLKQYGFQVDFAPVADVRTDVKRAEIGIRSFGGDPSAVASMTAAFVQGLTEQGILPVLKHFPGHGAVSGNTHKGLGLSGRTAEEWRQADFVPFQAGLKAGARMVMLSHQSAPAVDPEHPASLSPIVAGLLRQELGFQGVILTDALRMDAIRDLYGSGEACVLAIEAGADMLLLPYNFTNGYNGVMDALRSGRLTESRIDESVRRILTLKLDAGLIIGVP